MSMSLEAMNALRSVVYHRLKSWDAAREAEKLLDCDVNTGEDLDDYLSCMDRPEDALTMSEDALKAAFGLVWVEDDEDDD